MLSDSGVPEEGVLADSGSAEDLSSPFPVRIESFIRRHHVMTLATVGGGWLPCVGDGSRECIPWVAHAFYAWLPAKEMAAAGSGDSTQRGDSASNGSQPSSCFVFAVNPDTRHGLEMSAHPHVAAAIALETRVVGRLQGLQIEGEVRLAEGSRGEAARRAYLRRFPYAVAMDFTLWLLEPTLAKFTDNTLGFGKKLIWKR